MAGRIALDLKQFKHLKSNGKTTTLQHKDGHVLTIAHDKLSPKFQNQLKALGKSAQSADKPTDSNEAKQDNVTQMSEGGIAPSYYVKGGDVEEQHYDEGGGVSPSAQSLFENVANQATTSEPNSEVQPSEPAQVPEALSPDASKAGSDTLTGLPATESTQDQATKEAEQDTNRPHFMTPENWAKLDPKLKLLSSDPALAQQMFPDLLSGQGLAGAPMKAGSNAIEALQASHAAGEAEKTKRLQDLGLAPKPANIEDVNQTPPTDQTRATASVPPEDKDKVPSYEDLYKQGYHQTMAGLQGERDAKQALAKEQAGILDQQVKDKQVAQQAFQKSFQDLNNERLAHIQDIQNGHIDPDKYWTGDANGNGSHSRIAAGIGMLLAGFNPTGNPNAAIQYLQHQMDSNLEAQKQNLNSKQNLLLANLRQFGNLKDATEMTRIMQNDVVENQLKAAASRASNPMAQAEMQKAIGAFQTDSMQRSMNMSMRQAMMNIAGGGAGSQSEGALDQMIGMMHSLNPEYAKALSAARVPGYGISKSLSPVPDKVREQLMAKDQLNNTAADLHDWASKHTGSLNPKDIAIGKQKAQLLQSLYREGVLNTVYREGEQPLLDKVVNSDPTSFFNSVSTLPKLEEIIRGNNLQRAQVAKSYGLNAPQQAQPQYKTVNGVRYMRGPNGEAIPVK